jgi:hypothetical protein
MSLEVNVVQGYGRRLVSLSDDASFVDRNFEIFKARLKDFRSDIEEHATTRGGQTLVTWRAVSQDLDADSRALSPQQKQRICKLYGLTVTKYNRIHENAAQAIVHAQSGRGSPRLRPVTKFTGETSHYKAYCIGFLENPSKSNKALYEHFMQHNFTRIYRSLGEVYYSDDALKAALRTPIERLSPDQKQAICQAYATHIRSTNEIDTEIFQYIDHAMNHPDQIFSRVASSPSSQRHDAESSRVGPRHMMSRAPSPFEEDELSSPRSLHFSDEESSGRSRSRDRRREDYVPIDSPRTSLDRRDRADFVDDEEEVSPLLVADYAEALPDPRRATIFSAATVRENQLIQQCKNPSDTFIASSDYDEVHEEMQDIFENERRTEAFKQLKDDLTPSLFSSMRMNKFLHIEHALKFQSIAEIDASTKKMICEAFHQYHQYKQKAEAEKGQKEIDARKKKFTESIEHLDKLQKKGGATQDQIDFMRARLRNAIITSDSTDVTLAKTKNCMKSGSNDSAYLRVTQLIHKRTSATSDQSYTIDKLSVDDKSLIIRAYKIYMREKVGSNDPGQTLQELDHVMQLGARVRDPSTLQRKRVEREQRLIDEPMSLPRRQLTASSEELVDEETGPLTPRSARRQMSSRPADFEEFDPSRLRQRVPQTLAPRSSRVPDEDLLRRSPQRTEFRAPTMRRPSERDEFEEFEPRSTRRDVSPTLDRRTASGRGLSDVRRQPTRRSPSPVRTQVADKTARKRADGPTVSYRPASVYASDFRPRRKKAVEPTEGPTMRLSGTTYRGRRREEEL